MSGPGQWEDFGFDSMVKLEQASAGDTWEGWWTKEGMHPQYGPNYTLTNEKGEKSVIPGAGMLKFIMSRDFEKFDYVRITYLGMGILEKGKWKGKESHNFKVQKAVDWSGERKKRLLA